jgi:hypothetical protein
VRPTGLEPSASDGNKRAGWMSLREFCARNGYRLTARSVDDAVLTVEALAAHDIDEARGPPRRFALVTLLFGAAAIAGLAESQVWRTDSALELVVGTAIAAATGLLWAAFKATALVVTYLWRIQARSRRPSPHRRHAAVVPHSASFDPDAGPSC